CDVVGTAEPVCAVSSTPREDRTMLVECHPHGDPDSWLLENPGFVSGGNLRWWRDHFFGPDSEYDAICAPAADVAPGAEGLVFLPCMQGAMAPEVYGQFTGVAAEVDAFVAYCPEEHTPDPERRRFYDNAYRRYREVYFALKPVFDT